MILEWTEGALAERRAIYDYIEADNRRAALALDEMFKRRAKGLQAHPHLGRPGRVEGTRELVIHRHYVLVYDVRGETIRILRLLHTSLQWPPG
ncbi:MAG: type II toxin-antitoxin system RelE/ParE family toxin [Alphaproteobacteria bacterium]|nr:type II toxin-antitoxin system RelE/ParE family toxin [Alphaproteobacteria bacterium]